MCAACGLHRGPQEDALRENALAAGMERPEKHVIASAGQREGKEETEKGRRRKVGGDEKIKEGRGEERNPRMRDQVYLVNFEVGDRYIDRRRRGKRRKRRRVKEEPHESRRASSITGVPLTGMGTPAWNKWTVIAHNLSSELNHSALREPSVKHSSHTNLITFSLTLPPHGDVTFHLQLRGGGEEARRRGDDASRVINLVYICMRDIGHSVAGLQSGAGSCLRNSSVFYRRTF
ncbi:unnamed protein product [Pleuronectes platessa]|uniref:Uncharacterized protein n=1 Tax=Pleuronectes platessa TaxID=8262 RepID=A0A9N7YT88_PLEPL|nr:unnamed protein product [Pleuronectes platessa]